MMRSLVPLRVERRMGPCIMETAMRRLPASSWFADLHTATGSTGSLLHARENAATLHAPITCATLISIHQVLAVFIAAHALDRRCIGSSTLRPPGRFVEVIEAGRLSGHAQRMQKRRHTLDEALPHSIRAIR